MGRDRLTIEEFDEVFTDHLTRNPAVRGSFGKLPVDVRGKLKAEWFDVWRGVPFEDLQAASKAFLADPDHRLSPGKDMNKHVGRILKLAKELWGNRRRDTISYESTFAPGEGPAQPGCPICQGRNGRRVEVWPFGEYRSWAIEIYGPDHWRAARGVKLICPCNGDAIEALEEMYEVDARDDHFPRTKPMGDDWPLSVPTVFDEDRHDRYDFKTYFLTKCRHEKDVLELGKPRNRYGPNPNTGQSMLDDVVDMVWGDAPARPVPDHLRNFKPWGGAYKPAGGMRPRPEPKPVGRIVDRVTEDIEKAVAVRDRQVPAGDREDGFEPSAEDLRTAAEKYREPGEPTFLGMDADELDGELGPPSDVTLNHEAPAEPDKLSKEERRRRRRAALGKD